MRDLTKYRKKQRGINLTPENYNGYDYQYNLMQDYRNDTGLLDTNQVFIAEVVKVIKLTSGDYPFVVVARSSLLDEALPDKSLKDYEDSPDIALLDHFVPESLDLREPAVGEQIYITYTDVSNRLGGVYIAPVKQPSLAEVVIEGIGEIAKNVSEYFSASKEKQSTTRTTLGDCRYSNRQTGQVDYSSCSIEGKAEGEYEIRLGDGNNAGKVKMVFIDFNPRREKLIAEIAYRSLRKMFEDAQQQNINLRINDAFRSYEKQECFYRNYKTCLDEWNKSGKAGPKPSAAANPKNITNNSSNHMNGKAADFNTGTSRTDVGLKDVFALGKKDPAQALEEAKRRVDLGNVSSTKEWKWLINNSEKYGWVWSGIKFREPWHFHFDENLARRNNML